MELFSFIRIKKGSEVLKLLQKVVFHENQHILELESHKLSIFN